MPDNRQVRFPTHDFPPAFPEDFKADTSYFYQAVEEHNNERIACGLRAQAYSRLSVAEQHDVLFRANKIKLAAQAKAQPAVQAQVIPIRDIPQSQPQVIPRPVGMGFIGFFLLVSGGLTLIALLAKIL